MRAAVVDSYGPPECVEVREIDPPRLGRDEVLVRVAAVAVTAGDARIRGARFPRGFALPARLALGVRRPRRSVLGSALSGTVESVGAEVTGFAVGDRVAGMCGVRMGGHAELNAVQAKRLVAVPGGVDHVSAAGCLFGGTTALHFLRDRVEPGTTVLVNGASGAVGTSAVQVARHFGATVCAVASEGNHALLTRLGADEVIDYRTSPVVDLDRRFDLVLDTVGNIRSAQGRELLTDGGTLVLAAATLGEILRPRRQVVTGTSPERASDIALLLDLVADGRLDPVTQSLPGLDAVVEAHQIVDSGRKVGNLVLRLET